MLTNFEAYTQALCNTTLVLQTNTQQLVQNGSEQNVVIAAQGLAWQPIKTAPGKERLCLPLTPSHPEHDLA